MNKSDLKLALLPHPQTFGHTPLAKADGHRTCGPGTAGALHHPPTFQSLED